MTDELHKLGEVLRAARESKGVDLPRVERETKIRERYLSALERGEYRELPGSVYTKGFLRNYGAYLGLDPEYLIDLYRIETTELRAERPAPPAPPRPISGRRNRAFVVTPNAVVAAILTLLVGGFIAYLGFEFVNFARTPELRITQPAGNVNQHPERSITLRGVTAPNATVTVDNMPENPSVTADADGTFEVTVELRPGSNVVRLMARDPVTQRDSEPEERTIVVASELGPSPSAGAVALTVTEPAADASVTGAVPLTGTAPPNAAITVTATLVETAAPNFTISDAAGQPISISPVDPFDPDPTTLTADPSGAFAGELSLRAGTWDITLAVEGSEPVVRLVRVAPTEGIGATLRVVDADSYLEVDEDGTPVPDLSGSIASDGDSFTLQADDDLRIRAGNAGAVRLVINGIDLGAMGEDGAVVEWRIGPGQ
ncbi:MAG TPA: RodZ domain-containing protein [Candidatus Limnocylindria bacterium]|nr:RodZ domain-containing protein [Candidatus Limnocylindria bacterium]